MIKTLLLLIVVFTISETVVTDVNGDSKHFEYTSHAYVRKPAPNFKAKALLPNGEFGEVSLLDYKGKYIVLSFYPLDFTFVCPTEISNFLKFFN